MMILILIMTPLLSDPKIKKIKYEGENGYFINQEYYNNIKDLDNEVEFYKGLCKEYEELIGLHKKSAESIKALNSLLRNELTGYDATKKKLELRTKALTITIGLGVGELLLLAGVITGTALYLQK